MTGRTSIFSAPVPENPLDVSDFAPRPQPDARPRVEVRITNDMGLSRRGVFELNR